MNDVQLHRSILKEFGRELTEDSLILDFGCGDGAMVNQYRRSGLQAFGVDVRLDRDSDLLRLIPTTPTYRIPFDKESFDFVFSNSVRHVEDLDSALSEIYRVKPRKPSHLSSPRQTNRATRTGKLGIYGQLSSCFLLSQRYMDCFTPGVSTSKSQHARNKRWEPTGPTLWTCPLRQLPR